jgi:hypothetical protein
MGHPMKSIPLSDTRVTFPAYEKRIQQVEQEVREAIGLSQGLYTGPIEDIQPGDVISGERMEEYMLFMRTKNIIPRQWGFFESWKDNGNRPFSGPTPPPPVNPFET